MQSDVVDSGIRMRDQVGGDKAAGSTSPPEAKHSHKDLLAGIGLLAQGGSAAGRAGAAASHPTGKLAGQFAAPALKSSQPAPQIALPRGSSSGQSQPASASSTPRGPSASTPTGSGGNRPADAAPGINGSTAASSRPPGPLPASKTQSPAIGALQGGGIKPSTGGVPVAGGAMAGASRTPPAAVQAAAAQAQAAARAAAQQQLQQAQMQGVALGAGRPQGAAAGSAAPAAASGGSSGVSSARTSISGAPPTAPQQQQLPPYHNPMFNAQDAGPSPLSLTKREAYTPAISDSMAAAVSRAQQQQPYAAASAHPPALQLPHTASGASLNRGNAAPVPAAGPPRAGRGGPGGLQSAVAQAGDLFVPGAVGYAMTNRPNDLQYLCELPTWTHQRPELCGLQIIAAATSAPEGSPAPVDPAAVTTQELMVAERAVVLELLDAFLGSGGRLVRPVLLQAQRISTAGGAGGRGPALKYVVREGAVHPTIAERVAPVLPICDYVAVLQRFVETRSAHCYGSVTHALAGALRGYLEDWQVMVSMMESQLARGALDLSRLTFYCQQPAAALAVLADVAAQAANSQRTSAGLLDLLHHRYIHSAGNGPGRALLQHLLSAAAAPYCACLERWLRQGVLDDPYHEFMVQENQALRRDAPASGSAPASALRASAFWRGRYTLRQVAASEDDQLAPGPATPGGMRQSSSGVAVAAKLDVPFFLNPVSEVILRTGKYQNVLRECGQPVAKPTLPQRSAAAAAAGAPPEPLPPLRYNPAQPGSLHQAVRAAHSAASSALLGFVLRGGAPGAGAERGAWAGSGGGSAGLMAVLHSIKHFFLLDQGDVLLCIMEVADEELSKPAKAIHRTRLQSLLEMAVKISSAATDPHADSLGFEMNPLPLEAMARAVTSAAAAAAAAAGSVAGSRPATFTAVADSPYGTPGVSHPSTTTPGGSRLLGPRDQDLPGWDLFLPTIKVGWPATLVVGGEELQQYQLLFKHLFALKRSERQLEATWVLLAGTKRLWRGGKVGDAGLAGEALARRKRQMALAHALCQQLLFAVQELVRYATLDVLEPLWDALVDGILHRAEDVDQVIEMHREFLRRACSGLLLDQARPLGCIVTLQHAASGFARHMAALWDRLQAGVEMSSKATQVTPNAIAAEQQLAASLGELQRLMGESAGHIQTLVGAVREHYEGLMVAGGGGAGTAGGGAAGGGAGGGLLAADWGSSSLEALQNLVERLDFTRPASGTLGAVLAEMVGRG